MLYCCTSSQYRTAFLSVVTCGQLNAVCHLGNSHNAVARVTTGVSRSRSMGNSPDVGVGLGSRWLANGMVGSRSATFSVGVGGCGSAPLWRKGDREINQNYIPHSNSVGAARLPATVSRARCRVLALEPCGGDGGGSGDSDRIVVDVPVAVGGVCNQDTSF